MCICAFARVRRVPKRRDPQDPGRARVLRRDHLAPRVRVSPLPYRRVRARPPEVSRRVPRRRLSRCLTNEFCASEHDRRRSDRGSRDARRGRETAMD